MASFVRYPSCSWARWHSGITADFGSGYRPMISSATRRLASVNRATSPPPPNWRWLSSNTADCHRQLRSGSPVDLAHDGIDRRDDGDAVGDEAAAHHVGQALQVGEARAA